MGAAEENSVLRQLLESQFPNLVGSHWHITSPETRNFNCISWAMCDTSRWWWPKPGYYWPPGAPEEETVGAFLAAFSRFRFTRCESSDLEQRYDKIALFTNANGTPTHVARQVASGLWTSKLGPFVDIEHKLEALEGHKYGRVDVILKRPRATSRPWLNLFFDFLMKKISEFPIGSRFATKSTPETQALATG